MSSTLRSNEQRARGPLRSGASGVAYVRVQKFEANDLVCNVQACLAYRNEGGITAVVLCQREKLEMEMACRRTIPYEQRYGSRYS